MTMHFILFRALTITLIAMVLFGVSAPDTAIAGTEPLMDQAMAFVIESVSPIYAMGTEPLMDMTHIA